MSRIKLRRRDHATTSRRPSGMGTAPALGLAVLGAGLGMVTGFVLGELAGPAAERSIRRGQFSTARRPGVADLVSQAQAALDGDLPLRECDLTVVPVGPGRIELRGWVNDRRARARAAHLVSDAVHADALINCLLVRGEDEDEDGDLDPDPADELFA